MHIIVQSGHSINVNDVAFAPDGHHLATCSADESVRLWNLTLACEAGVLAGHRGPVYRVVWDGASRWLATSGWDQDVRVWDVEARSCRHVLTGFGAPIYAISFSPDGRLVAAAPSRPRDKSKLSVHVWDVSGGKATKVTELPGSAGRLALNLDGTLLAIADDGHIDLCTLATGERRRIHDGRGGVNPTNLAFTPNGQALVFAAEQLISYDVRTGATTTRDLPAMVDRPDIYSPGLKNHRSVSVLADGTPVVHDYTRTHIVTDQLVTVPIACEAVAPDGRLLARVDGWNVELIDTESRATVRRLGGRLQVARFLGNMSRQFVLAVSPSEPLVATAAPDGLIRLWDLAAGPRPTVFPAHDGPINSLAFSPDGNRLASCGAGGVRVWPRVPGPPLMTVDLEEGARFVGFSADGSAVMVALWSAGIVALDADDGSILGRTDIGGGAESLAVSGINDVAAANINAVSIWPPFLSEPATSIKLGTGCAALAFAADGRLAIALGHSKWLNFQGREGRGIAMILGRRDEQTMVLEGHRAALMSVAFAPDDTLIATGAADGTVRIWNSRTGACQHAIDAHAGDVFALGWLPDGRRLASIGADAATRVWDPSDGRLVGTLLSLDEHDSVTFTPEGHYSSTKGGLAAVVARTGSGLHLFEEFDLELNRPDVVLRKLGYANEEILAAFEDAHRRRLARLGRHSVFTQPAVRRPSLTTAATPGQVSSSGTAHVSVDLTPGEHELERLHVTVNDVPIHGAAGIALNPARTRADLAIALTPGSNEIETWVRDASGALSNRLAYRVFDTRSGARRTLTVLAVGVSEYGDPALRLRFAAKDAVDLAAELDAAAHSFARVRTRVLADATREQILAAHALLADTETEDHVIVLFAGHGALRGTEFTFLPADAARDDLAATGVSYDDIEALLDAIPARRRLVLLDTCHSGEDELGAAAVRPLTGTAAGVVRGRSFLARDLAGEDSLSTTVHAAPVIGLGDVFADLRQESGAFVIAAAGSAEYAYERAELRNGVFTASVIQALRDVPNATVSRLAEMVATRVSALTGGRQRPMIRRENLADDYPIL
ncbi:caspase family protein [Actinoplanes sp. M2I2]|uniref:WD40 domain-containing protein n=1 Tax=Actinoplanes sp. M2I2 TaxID=1734444 RepID=UPI002020DE9B|nr:caspase family protein [Actinoplanes sp. M2I2]